MSSKLFTRILAVLALSLPLAPVLAAEGGVSVVDPYARAVPEVVPNSAAFMTLRNAGDTDRKLVAGRTPAAGTVELHTHINDEGVMRMRQVPEIAIPAGGETRLEPGGLHIMLIGLKQPLKPGDTLELELEFDDGSSQSLSVPVRKIGMEHMQHHHH